MQRERMVLGLGPNSKRRDGSQDEVITWEDDEDVKQTTEFYRELLVLGWDCKQMYAKLKTGEYVVGGVHAMRGIVVSKSEFVESVESAIKRSSDHIKTLKTLLPDQGGYPALRVPKKGGG